MSECRLCPRACGADREKGVGVCGAGSAVLAGRAALHFGEEPCVSGTRGSGAVFFAGCTLGCVYCQNYALSRARTGMPVTVARLADIFRELEGQGAHNINLVTGTQFAPQILEALALAAPGIPALWNSSGYETAETVALLSERVRVFMPDMKYALAEPAGRYSGAADYPERAGAAIKEMVRRTGPCRLDGEGLLQSGVLIRHLVLPGQVENTRRVIDWVSESFAPGEVLFSLMAQYTPWGDLSRSPELDRRLTQAEWEESLSALDASPIADGYVQELSAAGEEEIPAFDGTGIEPTAPKA